jgi:hypothetical protein
MVFYVSLNLHRRILAETAIVNNGCLLAGKFCSGTESPKSQLLFQFVEVPPPMVQKFLTAERDVT